MKVLVYYNKFTIITRVSYSTARVSPVCAALDSLDPRHLRDRLACTWRSISRCTTAVACALFVERAPRELEQLGCHSCSLSFASRLSRDASSSSLSLCRRYSLSRSLSLSLSAPLSRSLFVSLRRSSTSYTTNVQSLKS